MLLGGFEAADMRLGKGERRGEKERGRG